MNQNKTLSLILHLPTIKLIAPAVCGLFIYLLFPFVAQMQSEKEIKISLRSITQQTRTNPISASKKKLFFYDSRIMFALESGTVFLKKIDLTQIVFL